MHIRIQHQSAQTRDSLFLHAWDQNGLVCHIPGERSPDGLSFRFTLSGTTLDPREVAFKYRYSPDNWESDDYIRTVPAKTASELWTFDWSARCLTAAPGTMASFASLTVHAITEKRYRGGRLFVWIPETGRTLAIDEASRDEANLTSTFTLPLDSALQAGFHFKLAGPGSSRDFQDFEPNRTNRVWRPSDGAEVWIKSGQVDVRPAAIALLPVEVDFIYPPLLGTPILQIQDLVQDFSDSLNPTPPVPLDNQFSLSRYTVSVYAGAIYEIWWSTEPRETARRFRVPTDEPLSPSVAVNGYDHWLPAIPTASGHVEVLIHPNPGSTFGPSVELQTGIGAAAPHQVIAAVQQVGNTWRAAFDTFPGLPCWVALVGESRPDGPLKFQRSFQTVANATLTIHTADGIGGFSIDGPPAFEEAPTALRRQLMESVYGPEIVAGGVFDPWEMPHGTSTAGAQTYFVLRAPLAMSVSLLLMPVANVPGQPRQVQETPMRLTNDLRYWWTSVPAAQAPHGTFYRFAYKDGRELVSPEAKLGEAIDPAARWAHDQGKLIVDAGTGAEQSWSLVLDQNQLRDAFAGSAWRTMGWPALLIYEMHVRRFTQRNQVQGDFEQVARELNGGYLAKLPVTALELLPLHEFPGKQSWGYNPSLFFAIDSDYGGPVPFARLVRTAHDAGTAVLLDIVYNHMMESPLQAIARDVYVNGETAWGDMIYYAHPAACEFFRQALVYLWRAFRLDGFRFDSTETIVNGHRDDTSSAPFILARGADGKLKTGAGRGWEFLGLLRQAVRNAATALGEPWPYFVGENDPETTGMTDPDHGVMDGQWRFQEMYSLGGAAANDADQANGVRGSLDGAARPYWRSVSYAESHDSVSGQGGQQRITRRERTGSGRMMAKAVGAAALLAEGIPMLFMGEEAAEDLPFAFDMLANDPAFVLRLDDYEQTGTEFMQVLTWFRHLMGLRNNPANGLQGEDVQTTGQGRKTVAFARSHGRFFVVTTFGTPDQQQNLGWLGIPGGIYKEIFNSSWPEYQVHGEPQMNNGGYDARLSSGSLIELPSIGAVILERI